MQTMVTIFRQKHKWTWSQWLIYATKQSKYEVEGHIQTVVGMTIALECGRSSRLNLSTRTNSHSTHPAEPMMYGVHTRKIGHITALLVLARDLRVCVCGGGGGGATEGSQSSIQGQCPIGPVASVTMGMYPGCSRTTYWWHRQTVSIVS